MPAIPRDVPEPAGGGTPGIYMSTDAGLTWRLATAMTSFPGGTVYSIGPGATAAELYAIVPDYTGFQPLISTSLTTAVATGPSCPTCPPPLRRA